MTFIGDANGPEGPIYKQDKELTCFTHWLIWASRDVQKRRPLVHMELMRCVDGCGQCLPIYIIDSLIWPFVRCSKAVNMGVDGLLIELSN